MWTFDPLTGRFKATVGNRMFDIEPPSFGMAHKVWTLWFRRDSKPHRSLQVGAFDTIEQAKDAAQAIIQQIAINTSVMQE